MTINEIKYFSKLKQKKFRDSENRFLIEGEHLIEECLESGFYKNNLEKVIVRKDFDNETLLSKINSHKGSPEIISIDTKSFNQISETVNSQGIIGVVSKLNTELSQNSVDSKLTVALDSINDPGNLGAIIRTCYWFGVDELLIGKESVELYNSKVIRASQGALFNLNIREEVDMEKELQAKDNKGFRIYLTDLSSDKYISELKFASDEKYLFVFGNESNGINKKILGNRNYEKMRIKGFSDCESLNISVAAGIVLNEFVKFV